MKTSSNHHASYFADDYAVPTPWPASHIPRYVVIADRLRKRINTGVWRAGVLLPSLHELAREFGVARPTARQAVQVLVREGLLTSRRGHGTFVAQEAAPVKTTPLETSLVELGQTYRALVPVILEIDEIPRRLPNDQDGPQDYIYMRRLHSLEGRPYCVISLYIARSVFNSAPEQFRTRPVIPLMLKHRSLIISQAHQTLTIAPADAETAGLLGIPVEAPLANMTRTFHGGDDGVIYYAEVSYRGDAIRMEIDLKP